MDRIFLDANVLFSAAYRANAGLTRLWTADVELLTSRYAIEEARLNLAEEIQRDRLEKLLRNVRVVAELTSAPLPQDIDLPEKDRPILLAAMAAKASHLVTGDKQDFGRHFGKRLGGVLVLPPSEYLNRAAGRNKS
ncbi:MAG: PIN domain-containing protein [Gammaproteobacteria bacterium]